MNPLPLVFLLALAAPVPADLATKQLLAELATPIPAKHEATAEDRKMPELPKVDLKVYAAKSDPDSKFQQAVRKARLALWAASMEKPPADLAKEVLQLRVKQKLDITSLRTRYPYPPANRETIFKNQLMATGIDLARYAAHLEDVLDELNEANKERDKQPKRWRAHGDLVHALVLVRLVQLSGMQLALGQMRKEFPIRGQNDKAWHLVSKFAISDFPSRKYAKQAGALLLQIKKEHPGTPWAKLAEVASKVPLGAEWKGGK